MNLTHQHPRGLWAFSLVAEIFLALSQIAGAQPFIYRDSDLCLGFRKIAPYSDNNQAVVNIGQASRYVNAALGTTLSVTNFSSSQLASPTFANLSNLTWSVFGWFAVPNTNYQDYPAYTIWVTVPRADNSVRSVDANRHGATEQGLAVNKMVSILANAAFVSHDMGASNAYNTASFVRESIATYSDHLYRNWMQDLEGGSTGTLNDTWTDNNLEITTPGNFTGAVRSDLYEVRPLDNGHGGTVVDPYTGTSGLAYYVGYFEFNSNGSMTFTRQTATTTPSQVSLHIQRTNNVNTISFPSASGVTYSLRFTNSTGLGAPVSTWASQPGTITGDGTTKSFQDTATDPTRLYRVQEQ
jgi:hypothetical protein